MRILSILLIPMLACTAAFAQESPLVVIGASSAGRIEMFDPPLLTPIGTLPVARSVESVSASPDGRRLYVGRDGLFVVDLDTLRMCPLFSPAMFGVPSPDGRFLFTQREKGGVEVFDAKTLARLSPIETHGTYNLQPAPDGSSLFGITNTPKPAVDIFDVERREVVRQIPLPAGPATGVWMGRDFCVFAYSDGGARLWLLRANSTNLPPAVPVSMPDLHGNCQEPVPLTLAGMPGRLLIAEAFGFKVDRRHACAEQARGGIYAINPRTGQVEEHIADGMHVNRMVLDPESKELYVIESTEPGEKSASRLMRVDPFTGRIKASRDLSPGTWNLTLAHIPSSLIPNIRSGALMRGSCQH